MFALWRNGSQPLRESLKLIVLSSKLSYTPQHHVVQRPVSLLQFAGYKSVGSWGSRVPTGLPSSSPLLPLAVDDFGAIGIRNKTTWLTCGTLHRIAGYSTCSTVAKERSAAVQGVPVLSISRAAEPTVIELTKEHAEIPFAAKAFYLGSKIDVSGLRSRAEREGFPAHFHKSAKGNESTVICLRKGPPMSEDQHVTGLPLEAYMMAFSYGSVVIFNAHSDLLMKALLTMCRDFTKLQQTDDFTEEMMIKLRPDMEVWSAHSPEYIKLKRLDWSNMRVISSVLGQSVALDFYARNVENMLDRFVDMNLEMHKTGSLSASIGKDELLKLVAQNNLILTDIITKLGLLDYHDVAWKTSQYGRIWEYLRRDFDVEARFETLSDKLTLVQENLKYYLELRQHQKSDTLEWIIIIMIGAEIAISLWEMSRHLM